jgi:diacylglycerol kinase
MSIKRFINSLKYAYWGLKRVFEEEQNFKIHTFTAIIVLIISVFIFNFSYIELAITLICIALVLTAEIINTAIENTWDHLEPNHHPVVKSVKDMMAGSVMLVSIFSSIIWLIIIIHHLYRF